MEWLVLTALGILVELILQKYSKEQHKVVILVIGTFVFGLISIIYDLWGKIEDPGEIYNYINQVISNYTSITHFN